MKQKIQNFGLLPPLGKFIVAKFGRSDQLLKNNQRKPYKNRLTSHVLKKRIPVMKMRALAHNHIYSVSGMVAGTSALKARQLLPHLNLTCTLKQQNKHTDLKYRVNPKKTKTKLEN